jgi:hypothetical protein
MASMVNGHDVVAFGKLVEGGEPVERARRGEAVEQHQCGCAFGTLILDNADATAALQVEKALATLVAWHAPRRRRNFTQLSFFCHGP